MTSFNALDSKRSSITKEIRNCLLELDDMKMGMNKSLVDKDGYPLANVNLYHVKHLRGKVRTLSNDLDALNKEIELMLPTLLSQNQRAFAKIVKVNPNSPSFNSGIRSNDLILEWGSLIGNISSLEAIKNEYQSCKSEFCIKVSRQTIHYSFTIPHSQELGLQIDLL